MIPYGRQSIDETDVEQVCAALRSNWLTTGPKVDEFERCFAEYCGAPHAIAVSSGTAALHAAMFALEIGPGDEVLVSTMTFAASANCVVYQGGIPVFVDVDPDTGLIDPKDAAARITPKTKAIIAVDYAGQPCDYDALAALANAHGLALVADACHSPGATYKRRRVGTLADVTLFSFHPVKHITTGEGGMAVTASAELARRMRTFRNHGILTDHRQREAQGAWFYEMEELGYNYRISDLHCALGISQLSKLDGWLVRRREIASRYDEAFRGWELAGPLRTAPDVEHAYHLYVIRLAHASRDVVFAELRRAGLGVNVHYIPVHLHPFYRREYGTAAGMCPNAEALFERVLSLPCFPGMTDEQCEEVIATVQRVVTSQPVEAGKAFAVQA